MDARRAAAAAALLPRAAAVQAWSDIAEMISRFPTRAHDGPCAVAVSQYVMNVLKKGAGPEAELRGRTVKAIEHDDFTQQSVIARIEGRDLPDELVILGCHIDSRNHQNNGTVPEWKAEAPGADDDASGVSTLFAFWRLLAPLRWRPRRTLELHFYAAEEAGLWGSKDIAQRYKTDGRRVVGMLQLDQTAYVQPGRPRSIGVHVNGPHADYALTELLRQAIRDVTGMEPADVRLNGARSDHFSWADQAYPACHIIESDSLETSSDLTHSTRDTLETLDKEQWLHVARAALAWASTMLKGVERA
jgi:leucyl aminopeptidase